MSRRGSPNRPEEMGFRQRKAPPALTARQAAALSKASFFAAGCWVDHPADFEIEHHFRDGTAAAARLEHGKNGHRIRPEAAEESLGEGMDLGFSRKPAVRRVHDGRVLRKLLFSRNSADALS